MTDGRDLKLAVTEPLLKDALNSPNVIIINDISEDKTLSRDLHRCFKIKVSNYMIIPIFNEMYEIIIYFY